VADYIVLDNPVAGRVVINDIALFLRRNRTQTNSRLEKKDVRKLLRAIASEPDHAGWAGAVLLARCGRDFTWRKGERRIVQFAGTIVGYANVRPLPGGELMAGVVIDKYHRRSGLAKCLMTAMVLAPHLAGANTPGRPLLALVRPTNRRMLKIIGGAGFKYEREVALDACAFPAIRHMVSRQRAGKTNSAVTFRRYVFDDAQLPTYRGLARKYRDTGTLGDGRTVTIQIASWCTASGGDPLA
jgi:hypothetical protein